MASSCEWKYFGPSQAWSQSGLIKVEEEGVKLGERPADDFDQIDQKVVVHVI
jgi:hypothetical protein